MKQKVYAYILRTEKKRRELLIFKHKNYPEAGIQVPGGTLEKGETPKQAVLREVKEEAGLEKFEVISYLGETVYWSAQKKEYHKRYYFQLEYAGKSQREFTFVVEGSGQDKGLVFDYKWEDIEKLPTLAGEQDELLTGLNL